jgi:glycosyltransferase involved in cell wall biosynthesis
MLVHFLASTLVRGGAETMAVSLSERLARRGHDVRWSLLRAPGALGETLSAGMDLRTQLAPGRYPWNGLWALRRRLAGADALYVLDHQNAVVCAAVAGSLARVPRRVVAVHTTGRWGGRASLPSGFRRALRGYHAVLALSRVHADYLVREEGVHEKKIRIVPNGIDSDLFAALPGREDARRRLDLPGDAVVVGCVAMLRPEKNHALLLDALAPLRARYPSLRVVLVGEGPERAALEARAARDDLRGAVRFLGLREDVATILPALDVFVLPSLPAVETQPVSVLEAMAAGVPVVATRVGDVETLLDGGRAGVLVPSGNVESLAAALMRVLDDAGLRSDLVARGREVATRFTLDRSADALLAVLEER